jgi:hypothetical protein
MREYVSRRRNESLAQSNSLFVVTQVVCKLLHQIKTVEGGNSASTVGQRTTD